MTGPRRLSDGDRICAALIGAARGYRPPERTTRQTLRALGLPLTATAAITAMASAAAGASPALKVGLVVCAMSVAAGGATVAYRLTAVLPDAEHAARTKVVAPRPTRPHFAHHDTTAPEAPVLVPPPPEEARPTVPRKALPVAVPHPVARRTPQRNATVGSYQPPPFIASTGTPESLAQELALLETAERALRRSDSRAALSALEEHARSFPGSSLGDEALVLRIAALKEGGLQSEARREAGSFLARKPNSILVHRVRALLSEPTTTTISDERQKL